MGAEVAAQGHLSKHRRSLTSNINDQLFLKLTLQEQYERPERLGLPVPVIESDNEEDYASDDADNSR